jgi:hypothetical protein
MAVQVRGMYYVWLSPGMLQFWAREFESDHPQLVYEGRKSKKIIASRDISYAFTNVMANHYHSLRMKSL